MSILPKWSVMVMVSCSLSLLPACLPVRGLSSPTTPPPSLEPTPPASIALTAPTGAATTTGANPSVLYAGTIILEASYQAGYQSESGYSSDDHEKASFDFDANQTASAQTDDSDIGFALTEPHPDSILVLHPTFGAKGELIEWGKPSYVPDSESFDFEACAGAIGEFGTGGIPIPALGSYYCWLTNDGRLVEFIVAKIEALPGMANSYQVEISYVVWDSILRK